MKGPGSVGDTRLNSSFKFLFHPPSPLPAWNCRGWYRRAVYDEEASERGRGSSVLRSEAMARYSLSP